MHYLSEKFDDIHLSGFKVIAETGLDFKTLTVAFRLECGNPNLYATHLLIMLYLSMTSH